MKKPIQLILSVLFIFGLASCVQQNETLHKPKIQGMQDIYYTIGDEHPNYLDGITATDIEDGDITADIYYDDHDIDYETAGDYTLTYYVIDSDGHLVDESITVFVSILQIEDEIAPEISGMKNLSYVIGDERPNYLLNLTASDNIDGDLTNSIIVDDQYVNYEVPGSYYIIYTVYDAAGNSDIETVQITVSDQSLDVSFDVYYLNDFHGSILENDDQMGFAKIANLIMTKKEENPNQTLFLAGGDMLQGSLLSNYFDGASTMAMLNLMELDAFVIGNHEFDWGLDVVLQYFDENSDAPVHADFPFLGANVIEKATGERPEGLDAYTIIEKQGFKIGVIGTMGYGLESSIAASRIADYEFQDPVEWTAHYAAYLRTIEDVDLVLAVTHGDDNYFNNSVAALTGDERVDGIYNGHTHQSYIETISRTGINAFVMQSASNGRYVGYTNYAFVNGVYSSYTTNNYKSSNEPLLRSVQPDMQALIDSYVDQVSGLINTTIITAGEYLDNSNLTKYMAQIMRVKTNSDIAFHNYGGTRTTVKQGTPMTVSLAYEIFPFDNVIKTTELLGSTINSMLSYSSWGSDTNITTFDNNTYYKVATNDYIYDGNPNTFNSGKNAVNTGILLRDLFVEVLEDFRDAGHSYFYFSLNVPEPLSIVMFTPLWHRETDLLRDIINA